MNIATGMASLTNHALGRLNLAFTRKSGIDRLRHLAAERDALSRQAASLQERLAETTAKVAALESEVCGLRNGESDYAAIVRILQQWPADSKRALVERVIRDSLPLAGFGTIGQPLFGGYKLTGEHEPDADALLYSVRGLFDSQSIGFTVDVLPLLQTMVFDWPHGPFTLLDVGSRTGAGANLIGSLFRAVWSVPSIQTTVLDIETKFRDYSRVAMPFVEDYRCEDLFDYADGSYDLVLCSHTIEHLPDPTEFIRKAASVAKYYAIFYCPYRETNPIPGHYTVDDAVIDRHNPIYKSVCKSWWWRTPTNIRPDCVMFVIPGSQHQSAPPTTWPPMPK